MSTMRLHNRYMHTAEVIDARGIPAVPVSLRTAALLSSAKKDFIWWLQGMSLQDGGLRKLAVDLLEAFPKRYDRGELENLLNRRFSSNIDGALNCRDLCLEDFFTELCINPKLTFEIPGSDEILNHREVELAAETGRGFIQEARLNGFKDIVGALVEFRQRKAKAVQDAFYVTAIGRQIWETLNFALRTRSMVMVYGREGRGKTEAVKAWCQINAGRVRLVSLKGIANKTSALREISLALGITTAYTRTGGEMQARIEDVLKRSKIMLVLDEAHFLFNQSQRTKTRPEMIDWIDTAFSNCDIPLALCSTPQFMDYMARAAYQAEWNYNQFRRRVSRWIALPEENTEGDIMGVAARVFDGASSAVLKMVLSYVYASGRDLSALGDVARELRELLGSQDLSRATLSQVKQVTQELYKSDNAFLSVMEPARQRYAKARRTMPREIDQQPAAPIQTLPEIPKTEPAREATPQTASRRRGDLGSGMESGPSQRSRSEGLLTGS